MSNISRAESTILFVGYQATGTLGREIVDGAKQVGILGRTYTVSARIIQMNGLSGHADRDELLRWLSGLQTPLSHLFVTHGEPDVSQYFANFLRKRTGWEISVPQYRDKVILD